MEDTRCCAAQAPASSTPRGTAGAASAGTVNVCASRNRLIFSRSESHWTKRHHLHRLAQPSRKGARLPISSSTDATLDSHPWAHEPVTLRDHAWQRLIRGVNDRHAPSRHPTLSTVSPEGLPQARTVVLRAADRSRCRLEIHTNLYSAKVDGLRHTPVAALHVWESGSSLQIRLLADVTITTGADAAAA